MAHRHKTGETGTAGVDISRRAALTRLGFGISVAYAAPALLSLSAAQAGVVIGDGDVNNDNGGGKGGGGGGTGKDNGAPGHHIGANRRAKPEGGGERMTLQELLDYLADLAKKK